MAWSSTPCEARVTPLASLSNDTGFISWLRASREKVVSFNGPAVRRGESICRLLNEAHSPNCTSNSTT